MSRRSATTTSIVFLLVLALPAAAKELPVKVFVLAGQSNMEGAGRVEGDPQHNEGKGCLSYLVENSDAYKQLKGPDGQWLERGDVWIWYLGRKGKLAPGFGVKPGSIGPELSFGQVIGDAFEEPVLLIKTAWGGKSLQKDLPFVIADSGFGGVGQKVDRRLMIRAAQAAAADNPEFDGSVACVQTETFFRPPEESPSRQGYHWNGNAETYYLIGTSMAEAMKKLCGK